MKSAERIRYDLRASLDVCDIGVVCTQLCIPPTYHTFLRLVKYPDEVAVVGVHDGFVESEVVSPLDTYSIIYTM